MKKRIKYIIIGVIAVIGLGLWVLRKQIMRIFVIVLLVASSMLAKVEVYTDVTEYNRYMLGEEADEQFQSKWGMDETIFPEAIAEDMQVTDYKMVYYNPWDAQYLSYLVVQYEEADYENEVSRLQEYQSTNYLGNYGVTGFQEGYELLAMYADDYQGFVYALTDSEDTIIYVELIFCNYFYDLDYESYIPREYLPTGFDAYHDNAYQKKMLGQ